MNHRHHFRNSHRSVPVGIAAGNLWLAIGDETGQFKDAGSTEFHGVGIILARPAALAAALNEQLDGRTVRQIMNTCVPGLENWLRSQGSDKANELNRHHVREAWQFLNDQRSLTGNYSVGAIAPEPVLNHLLSSFSWLASHPQIISLGLHGSGRDLLAGFWKGSDEMAAIGALYGRMLALVKPFLGTAPRIRMLAGVRSEALDTKAIKRAGQAVGAPVPGKNRQSSSVTGGSRTMLEAMETEFWRTLALAEAWWPVPATLAARQVVFEGFAERKELAARLKGEDSVAAQLISADAGALGNLADLATSLMAASCDSRTRPLRINFPKPLGRNILFLSSAEAQA